MKRTVLLALSLISSSVIAQNIAIVGGQVHTVSQQGVLETGTVLVKDGKIEAITESSNVPSGYTKIDASGKVVTPGLVGAMTSLGLVEVSLSAGVVDSSVDEPMVSKTGAALDVSYAVNPDSTLIGISRLEGITSAATSISRSDQLFLGQGAVITLDQGADPIVKPRAFMPVDVSNSGADDNGGTRAALWVAINTAFDEARSAGSLSGADDWHGLTSKADVKALQDVLNGNTRLFMHADRAADIRQVIAFSKRYPDIKVTVVSAIEGWRVAQELADAKIGVVLDPEYNLPGSFEHLGATLANAARLQEAGVTVAIGMQTHNIRLATQHAGNAVANGLPHAEGLAALTINPATLLGVNDQLGSLEVGKRADIVVWSGDPLEVTQNAEQVIIGGEMIEMTSRQQKLMQRYRALHLSEATNAHYIR